MRSALVTGGGSGIGAAVCRRLAEDGTRVAVFDIVGDKAAQVANDINEGSSEGLATAICGDVTIKDDLDGTVRRIESEIGSLHVLVNAAGIVIRAGIESTDDATWAKVIDVNLTGTFRACHAVMALMRKSVLADRSGRIVNIASTAAVRGHPYPSYTASKGGVLALSRGLARQLAPSGITVNAVNPGFIRTPINDELFADSARAKMISEMIPVGRTGRPEEVAEVVRFLSSVECSYVNAQTITVDGGMHEVFPLWYRSPGE